MSGRAVLEHEPSHDAGVGERELCARLRAGDAAAFEEVVRLCGGQMLATARRMLGTEADALDAVQEAFLSAFRSVAAYDGSASAGAWLRRITINACLMRLRSKRRRRECSIDELLPRFTADGHREPEQGRYWPAGGEDRDARVQVREAIARLDDSSREVIILRDIEGLDTREAALLLGLSESAVKSRLHRARQALRTLLSPIVRRAGDGE